MSKIEKAKELAKVEVASGEFRPWAMIKECRELSRVPVGDKETSEALKAFNAELDKGRDKLMSAFQW